MFGPELHAQNDRGAITLAPIEFNELPECIDPQIAEHLTDTFRTFLETLPRQHEWLEQGEDNVHWGIYCTDTARLLGITGVRNVGVNDDPAISRIALFNDSLRGRGIGALAYRAQYDYLLREHHTPQYEHTAANANIGSLRIARQVGFRAVHDDGLRTTMHLYRKQRAEV